MDKIGQLFEKINAELMTRIESGPMGDVSRHAGIIEGLELVLDMMLSAYHTGGD